MGDGVRLAGPVAFSYVPGEYIIYSNHFFSSKKSHLTYVLFPKYRSYFDPEPKRCMILKTFNASTTDPAKEFASSPDLLLAPTSESFSGSDEDFNGYWNVFLANSCMGPEPTTPSPTPVQTTPPSPSSAYYVTGGIEVVLFLGVVSSSLFLFFA